MFQGKIFAILRAIETIAGGPGSDSGSYMISVDSQAALRAIAPVWCKSRIVDEWKEALRTFGPHRIRLCWIPGQSGILNNETADALARLGSLSEGELIVLLLTLVLNLSF